MANPELKPGFLKWANGEARELLCDAFGDRDHDDAFRQALRALINNHCQMHDFAGRESAAVASALPNHDDPYIEAFLGKHMLTDANQVLAEILVDDAELRESVIGDVKSDTQTDRIIREASRVFDRRYKINREADFQESAREGMLSDDQYSDIAYGGDSKKIEREVGRSLRGELDGLEAAHIELHIDDKEKPTPMGTPRTRWDIRTLDLAGQPPIQCFQASTQWACRSIVHVGMGSLDKVSYPRLVPLTHVDDPAYSVTPANVRDWTRGIFQQVMQLQPPLPDNPDEFRFSVIELASCDPMVAMFSIRYMLAKFYPDDVEKLMSIFDGVDFENREKYADALNKLIKEAQKLN